MKKRSLQKRRKTKKQKLIKTCLIGKIIEEKGKML